MKDNSVRALLSFVDIASLMLFVGAIIYVPAIHLSDTMIGVILGLLGAYVKDSHSFWFNTTAGSTAKDAIIAASGPSSPVVLKAEQEVPKP